MTGHGVGAAAPEFDALPIGSRIARYEVRDVLGQGGFGITYLAFDERLGRDVAIKEYLPSFLAVRRDGASVQPRSTRMADDFAWGRERFVAEARTLATLHDAPGLVRVHDFLEANGTAYMVMECVQGRTLEAVLAERQRLGPAEVAAILEPLLLGLERIHAAGFLHRDIKPANILLRPDGKPTLIDFGASRAAVAGKTSALTAIFTPGYSAPEQITSAKQGPWTDLYALSATLYRAITGVLPPSAFDRVLDDEYQPVAQRAPAGFDPALLVAIDAGLVVHPADRPQSIAAWRCLLQAPSAPKTRPPLAAARSRDAPTVVMRSPMVPPGQNPAARTARPLLPVGLAVALALVLGGGAWLVLADRSGDQAREIASLREAAEEARRSATAEGEARRQAEQALASLNAERRAAEESRRQAELKASAEVEARKRAEAAQRIEDEQRKKAEEDAVRRADAEKRPTSVASLAPTIAVPASLDGSYTGALTTTTASGPLSMSFTATVTIANGQVVGELTERRCGVARFSVPLGASGDFAGRIRIPEDNSCSTTNADVAGTVGGGLLKVEVRSLRLRVFGSLKKKS